MFNRLKHWLGWGNESGSFDFSDFSRSHRDKLPTPKQPVVKSRAAAQRAVPPQAQPRPKTERAPLDVLDNPRLSLDKAAGDGFDPYNTGAFNRSDSWDRIGRQRKR